MTEKTFEKIESAAREAFALDIHDYHGEGHWARVGEIGAALAGRTQGADGEVVRLFAALHDCQRQSDGDDPQHGQRAADFAAALHTQGLFRLAKERREVLDFALRHHNERGSLCENPTVACCWDADRFDLKRFGAFDLKRFVEIFSLQSSRRIIENNQHPIRLDAPPKFLYHGTGAANREQIEKFGLRPNQRRRRFRVARTAMKAALVSKYRLPNITWGEAVYFSDSLAITHNYGHQSADERGYLIIHADVSRLDHSKLGLSQASPQWGKVVFHEPSYLFDKVHPLFKSQNLRFEIVKQLQAEGQSIPSFLHVLIKHEAARRLAIEAQKLYALHFEEWRSMWQEGLESSGECLYRAPVPPDAITKIEEFPRPVNNQAMQSELKKLSPEELSKKIKDSRFAAYWQANHDWLGLAIQERATVAPIVEQSAAELLHTLKTQTGAGQSITTPPDALYRELENLQDGLQLKGFEVAWINTGDAQKEQWTIRPLKEYSDAWREEGALLEAETQKVEKIYLEMERRAKAHCAMRRQFKTGQIKK
jgi:uncharacterized protein